MLNHLSVCLECAVFCGTPYILKVFSDKSKSRLTSVFFIVQFILGNSGRMCVKTGVRTISFWKKHGKTVSNILVVLLVAGAIYSKVQDNGVDSLFRASDLYILLGAMIGLLVIRWFGSRQKR